MSVGESGRKVREVDVERKVCGVKRLQRGVCGVNGRTCCLTKTKHVTDSDAIQCCHLEICKSAKLA